MLRAPNAYKPCEFTESKGLSWESERETNDVLSTSSLGAGSGPGHIEVLANADAAETWFEESDPEGVAFAI
jgi:hypothetical protein